MLNRRAAIFVLFFVLFMSLLGLIPRETLAGSEETSVIYPQRESKNDTRDDDLVEILKSALEKTVPTDGPYNMKPAILMNEGRYRQELYHGTLINVIWSVATVDAENDFLSVKIPLRKGILGYRVLLIRKQDREKFAAVRDINDLRKFTVGQGHTWNDLGVYRANGIKVVTGNDYESLFAMLMEGRFDYFSRGINEALAELEARKFKYPDMMLEENLLLYYPWPKFFYFNKKDKKLADRIEKGMNIMLHDGTFENLFRKFNQKHIDAVNFKHRRLIKLDNPLLPPSVPLDRKELWYDPMK